MSVITLPLSSIIVDQDIQSRADVNYDAIAEYAFLINDGIDLDPVVVFETDEGYLLADGFQRIEAYKGVGKRKIDVEVKQGTRRDAILYGIIANTKHGVRPTNEDKRKMVTRLLQDEEWSTWSDNVIAKKLGVTQPFVSGLRKELVAANQIKPREKVQAVRKGKIYNIKPDRNTKNETGRPTIEKPKTDDPIEEITLPFIQPSAEIEVNEIDLEKVKEINTAKKGGVWEAGRHTIYINNLSKLKSIIKDFYYCLYFDSVESLINVQDWIVEKSCDGLTIVIKNGQDLLKTLDVEIELQYATLAVLDERANALVHFGIVESQFEDFSTNDELLFIREVLEQMTQEEDQVLIVNPSVEILVLLDSLNRSVTIVTEDIDLAKNELLSWQQTYGNESPVSKVK